ncbi:MAG: hypothetical protein ACMUIM_01295 [bacterium]
MMKKGVLRILLISLVAFCVVLAMTGDFTWAQTENQAEQASRKMQEYFRNIITNPYGTWIEYRQTTSLEDLLLTGTYYPEITYRVQIPNLFPNWFTPSSEYTEYSRIGGIGGISIFPSIWGGIWDLTGSGGGGWYPGLTGGGTSWLTGGWPWGGIGTWPVAWPLGTGSWQGGGNTNPPNIIY